MKIVKKDELEAEEKLYKLEKDFAHGIADLMQLYCTSCHELIYKYHISDGYDPELNSYPVSCSGCESVINRIYVPDTTSGALRKLMPLISELIR